MMVQKIRGRKYRLAGVFFNSSIFLRIVFFSIPVWHLKFINIRLSLHHADIILIPKYPIRIRFISHTKRFCAWYWVIGISRDYKARLRFYQELHFYCAL